ncbi:hypothetical protein FGE12_20635 [Aggregicoccus sp. 17bor-14]|uniref:hypothetical protein n=1 Tax=Myxococcaceae TaxID=31 RepID=UPI00129C786D|nr:MULTISPECIES: hypothetical protein [Myxococcaceae]MBF5044818.1 hypothetical protein [Simulacricoccus sp. 17bor-14]MRI90562.1 hypothetical protein [Aggregicoccus sp. 17bor-14]
MKPALIAAALLPCLALAQTPPPAAPPAPSAQAQREHREQRLRTARVVALAEALELDSAGALKLDEALKKLDARREPLRAQVRDAAQVLERAASGDKAALGQAEGAAQKAFEARAQLAALDRELYQSLEKSLTPEKRAKLALILARRGGPAARMHGLGMHGARP